MDFKEDEFGNLRSKGNKGEYWITEEVWLHLSLVRATEHGPTLEKLGTFNGVVDAIEWAGEFDAG